VKCQWHFPSSYPDTFVVFPRKVFPGDHRLQLLKVDVIATFLTLVITSLERTYVLYGSTLFVVVAFLLPS